jgi:hypothetical protein
MLVNVFIGQSARRAFSERTGAAARNAPVHGLREPLPPAREISPQRRTR